MNSATMGKRAITGFVWRLFQNSGTQIVSFVVSIVLARILSPADYGLIAMITVFTNIAQIFINTGFSSAVVQKERITNADMSTMMFSSIALGGILYAVLYFSSPAIASFYGEPLLKDLLRVQSLTVLIGSFGSVHQALVTRRMLFKKSFVAGFIGVSAQSVLGIVLAINGFGAWALVWSVLANTVIVTIGSFVIAKWRPRLLFSIKSFTDTIGFCTKMLMAALIDSIFQNIRSLIIGKKYSGEDLAYYNKGNQFPTLIMLQIDGSMTTVLFSLLSKVQSDWDEGLRALRRAMKMSIYICAPLMAGLFAVARPMVLLLLTEKWEFAVEYVQLGCMVCMFWPLSAQRHALNARNKSGVALTFNIVSKLIMALMLVLTFRHGVHAMILSEVYAYLIIFLIGLFVYRKHLDYSICQQLGDVLPPILLSLIMGVAAYSVQFLQLSNLLTLVLQVATGAAVYIFLSFVFKLDSFVYLVNIVKSKFKNK